MMRKMVVLGVALVLSFVFCSVSEAASLENQIIGKWVELPEGKENIEFLKDGTLILGSDAVDYKFIDDNRLRVNYKMGAKIFEVSIDKEQLILKEPTGKVSIYITEKAYKTETGFLFFDSIVLDKSTKLMWTMDGSVAGWMSWNNALMFVRQLNQQGYAGYSDWRLPTKNELQTLINYANGNGVDTELDSFFNRIGFKKMQDGYWSSTPNASYRDVAWFVNMRKGRMSDDNMVNVHYVLPVRDGQ